MEKFPLDTTKEELLHQLYEKGIHNPAVLRALSVIPRERFVPELFARKAYNDVALPIGLDQTISQPYTVAFMTQQLDVHPHMKVLEIGTGSGYQAAVLACLGAEVYTIERHQALHERAAALLHNIAPSVRCFLGDGSTGLPHAAPFDRIIVTAGAPAVPPTLVEQLAIGGRLLLPVGDSAKQQMTIIERVSQDSIRHIQEQGDFSFVPLKGAQGWN